jgi:hypothetical protein
LALDNINQSIQSIVSLARRFAEAEDLLGIGLNLFFMELGYREQCADAFCGSRPPLVCSRPPLGS